MSNFQASVETNSEEQGSAVWSAQFVLPSYDSWQRSYSFGAVWQLCCPACSLPDGLFDDNGLSATFRDLCKSAQRLLRRLAYRSAPHTTVWTLHVTRILAILDNIPAGSPTLASWPWLPSASTSCRFHCIDHPKTEYSAPKPVSCPSTPQR